MWMDIEQKELKMGTYFTCTYLGVEKSVFNYIVSGIEQGKIL